MSEFHVEVVEVGPCSRLPNADTLMVALGLPIVPTLYRGPWSNDLRALAEGKTTMPGANHVREGIVVKPVKERFDPRIGRVFLKLAGESYLTRKGG